MKEIIIKTQKQLDKVKKDYDGYIYIEGGTKEEPLNLRVNFESAKVIVRGTAYIESVYGSAQIGYVYDSAQIRYVYDSAQIGSVYGSAQIGSVYDSAQIGSVYGSAQIGYVYDSAQIRYVSDSAQIGYVYDSAQIRYVSDSAQIRYVSDSAQIGYVYDSAQIDLFGEASIGNADSAKKIVCHGYNTVIVHKSDKSKINLVMNKTSHLVILPDNTLQTNPTVSEYVNRFPVKSEGVNLILYKAVHKKDGKYYSHHDNNFTYSIGEVKIHEIDKSIEQSCTTGLHVGTLPFALMFGNGWEDMAILECKVAKKDVIVSKDCDGKVRTSKLTVIRELPESEYWK